MPGSTRGDVGDVKGTRFYTYNSSDVLANATGVVCTFTDPAGATSTPTVTNVSTGIYYSEKQLNTAGLWTITWTSSAGTDIQYAEIDNE